MSLSIESLDLAEAERLRRKLYVKSRKLSKGQLKLVHDFMNKVREA